MKNCAKLSEIEEKVGKSNTIYNEIVVYGFNVIFKPNICLQSPKWDQMKFMELRNYCMSAISKRT